MCKHGTHTEVTLFEPDYGGLTKEGHEGRLKELGLKKDGELIDSCIAPLVQVLNDFKVKTITSCCSHNKTYSTIWINADYIQFKPRAYTWSICKPIIKLLSWLVLRLAWHGRQMRIELRFPPPEYEHYIKGKKSKMKINSKYTSTLHRNSLMG